METISANILVGSTIRQKPAILKQFLQSITELDRSDLKVDCLFIDNNDSEESTELLQNFKLDGGAIFLNGEKPGELYHCTEDTHHWSNSLIWKVAANKDLILKFALDHDYTHVFMVDSDLVFHPHTLKQLLSTKKDIISEIFWTRWVPESGELPQVWVAGQYSFYPSSDAMSEEEKKRYASHVIAQLRTPGLYQVGGLGACTLISRNAIVSGVNYGPIANLDYWGEDRHFCIRAVVLGFELYVDTHFPAFHIYRESDLSRIAEYKSGLTNSMTELPMRVKKEESCQRKATGNRLTLSMIVRNEADRYLTKVLEHARVYIDSAVIIDDASTDDTAKICEEVLKDIPLTLIRRKKSSFSNEYKLRQQQWRETVKAKPDWILALDADEMFENRAIAELPLLMNQTEFDYFSFRLYDFWDEYHYREDEFWQAHLSYRPFLVRYIPTFKYVWKETPVHCGRFPCNITELKGAASSLRVKHLGWANPRDRELKYQRYMKHDPDGKYGILQQYQSILDPNPNLIKWEGYE